MRKDKQATMDMQFLDPRSYVTPDSREVLYGKDWAARIEDLRLRSGGKCEWVSEPIYAGIWRARWRCEADAADPDHAVKRSKLRDDRLSNLQALCRFHHDLKHPEFRPRWTQRVEA